MKSPCKTIIKIVIGISFLIGLLFGLAKSEKAKAAINPLLSFTGKITNTDGTEVADGVYDFSFGLYTAPTGGSAIWSEDLTAATRFSGIISNVSVGTASTTYTYSAGSATSTLRLGQYLTNASTSESVLIIDYDTGANKVTVASGSPTWSNGQPINNRPNVEGGVININLGSVTDLFGVNFNQPLYLEVSFNSETMQPRKLLTAAPQAFESAKLGGKAEDEFAALAEDEIITGEWSFNNIVSVTASSTNTALTVTQNGSGSIVEFKHGTTTALAVLADGRVQIGDYIFPASRAGSSAGYVLKTDDVGNMYWDVDFAGTGGGSGLWASSTQAGYGGFVYQSDTGQKVLIGSNTLSGPTAIQFEIHGTSWFDDIGISEQQQVRFYDAGSSDYVALQATGTISSSFVLTLPASLGTDGQALLTDDNGNLYWGMPTGGGSVGTGTVGQIPYYASAGNILTATSTIFIDTSGYVGIGTTSPIWEFEVDGYGGFTGLCLGGSCITDWTGAGEVSGSGTAGYVTYWQNANTLTSEQTLAVSRGGTGLSSIADQSLLFATTTNVISEFTIGGEGTVLAVVSGKLAWATTSAPSSHAILSVSHSDVTPTSTLIRGDLLVADSANKWNRLALGATGYILYSDGNDAIWATTTSITALGTITTGAWHGDVIEVAYGGTGATTATGARANLDLDEVYKFAVNSTGTTGWLWQSDGDGRGHWVATSSLGLDGGSGSEVSKLVGTTTSTFNGAFATSTLIGYEAANNICSSEFSNSYFCRTYDILATIEQDDISNWTGSAWIAEGPPGYTSNSNDCKGWTSSSSVMLGAFWAFDSDGGGMGWLTNCSGEKPIACCRRQQ